MIETCIAAEKVETGERGKAGKSQNRVRVTFLRDEVGKVKIAENGKERDQDPARPSFEIQLPS